MIKFIILLVFSIIFLSHGISIASPEAAIWEKAIFLGTSEGHYYCLVIKRDWPNSYYDYSDELFIRKYDTKGNAVENIKLRGISYSNDASYTNKWKLKDEHMPNIHLADFLIENKVFLQFPKNVLIVKNTAGEYIDSRFELINNTLFVLTGNGKKVLADRKYIEMFFSKNIRHVFEDPMTVSLTEYYFDSVNVYFVISAGDFYCDECDAQQSVVVVPYEKLKHTVDSIKVRPDK